MADDKQPLGRELPRAKPVVLTFYDMLRDVPSTTTFYVSEDTSQEQIEALIQAVEALSECVLGKYNIGHREFIVPDYFKRFEAEKITAITGQKSVIKYRTENGASHSHSIPGRNPHMSINAKLSSPIGARGKKPDPDHPKWQAFLKIFREICVSKEGEKILEPINLDYSNQNWPPKSYRKRKH